jgi:hypothetical protein
MKLFKCVLIAAVSVLLLGNKGCEVNSQDINTKADVLENKSKILKVVPGLKIDPDKFDIERYSNVIVLTTDDSLTFREAVRILKTKTSLNKPVRISISLYGVTSIGAEGEFKTGHTPEEIIAFTGEQLRPYIGIIHIFDGWWRATEFDATSLFKGGQNLTVSLSASDERTVWVTEYAYANNTVYELNDFSQSRGIRSRFDKRKGAGTIQGDGSTPDEVTSVFYK